MSRRPIAIFLSLLLSLSAFLLAVPGVRAVAPANAPFQRTWERTDQPVLAGQVDRTWMWSPEASTAALTEPYAESPGGERTVQYYDKARMEITHPDTGDPSSIWYVTNGLLVVEMVSGQLQIGDAEFEEHGAAEVNVAGDPGDPDGPTYASFAEVLDEPAYQPGWIYTLRIARDGNLTDDPALEGQGVTSAVIDDVTQHSIATPFWDFMGSSGTVYEDGAYIEAKLFENRYFATGRPISEAYWATVQIGGTPRDVLMQCFERRCLTYTPGNPEGFVVEAGNVGQHYYAWRYQDAPDPPPVDPTSAQVVDVVDGDTIDVQFSDGTVERVRYIGIDTPEVYGGAQCYGPEASAANADLVERQTVRLVKDVSERDQYDRLLRYVYVGDTFVNDWLVRNGYAYASTYPPDVAYAEQFAAAQSEAQANNRGLWAACESEPEPPAGGEVPAEGDVLYQSDLGDWPSDISDTGAIGEPLEGGTGYGIVGSAGSIYYVFNAGPYGDASYGLTLFSLETSGDVSGCLVVRAALEQGAYHLCVAFSGGAALGTLGFYLLLDGSGELIELATHEFSPPKPATDFHTIKLIAQGNQFWFFADGANVGTATHAGSSSGLVGLGMTCVDASEVCAVGYTDLVIRSLASDGNGEPPPPPPPDPEPDCDSAYPGVCIPPPPPDLDCSDITERNFTVLPPDPHNFDADADGIGCES